MDLHRFWDGVITSSSNLSRLRNEATSLINRQWFQRSQLTELASSGFESWANESFDIATKIVYRNGEQMLLILLMLIIHLVLRTTQHQVE
jgi:hypothetical protein